MKSAVRLDKLGLVAYLVWAAVAVFRGQWLLAVILTVLLLPAMSRAALGGLAGLAVAVYVGEWWPAAAFALLVISRAATRFMPVWALRGRTDPGLLLAAVSTVDPATAGILANAARGGPISTLTLVAVAQSEAPDAWQGVLRVTAKPGWDGAILHDAAGREWTANAAEAVIMAGLLAAEQSALPVRQALGAGALLTPETALTDALPHMPTTDLAGRITGFSLLDLAQVMGRFAKSPMGVDAVRRIELRMTVDKDRSLPAQALFTASTRRLWLLLGVSLVLPAAAARAITRTIGDAP